MKTLQIMLLFTLLAGTLVGTNLFAQRADGEPKGAPTVQELKAVALDPSKINDAMLDSFVKADRKIREVQIKANQQIFQILDQEGLSVEKYNGIVQALSQDEKLLKKVQDKITEILKEEKEDKA